MKNLRRILFVFLLSFSMVGMVSCGDDAASTSNYTGEFVQYSVEFESNGGSAISSIIVNNSQTIAKPSDPTKEGFIFEGWYFDSNLSQVVTWPLSVNQNYSLYAKWTDATAYFLAAREELLDANQFEYDFNVSATLSYGSISGPSAIIDGNVKYNSTATNTYYQYEENSGLLLPDGTVYTIKTGTELAKIKQDTDGKVYSYETVAVASDFKYESSSYAKAMFTYGDDKISDVTQAEDGKYIIQYGVSVSGITNIAINALNTPIVEKFIDLPESSSGLTTYVTFANGEIDTYEYEFSATVSGVSITFHYDLDFKNIGSNVTISVPTFSGVALTPAAISTKLATINAAIDSYKALANSGYTYDVQTSVDFTGSNSIDSHTQGRTMRNVVGSNVYFWNRVEFDSDYKNSDLYSSSGIVDYERYRVVYSNNDVYDVIDGVLSNTYTKIDSYSNSAVDNYYFLIDSGILASSNVSVISETTASSGTVYSIGLNQAGLVALLDFIDVSVRVDVNAANEITIYDIASGLEITGCDFDITILSGSLVSIEIDIDGAYTANAYTGTDFSGPCSFSLEYELITNIQGASYTAPANNSQVDLSNS